MAKQTLNNWDSWLSFRTKINENFTDLYDNKQDILAEWAFIDWDKTKLDWIESWAEVNTVTPDNIVTFTNKTLDDITNYIWANHIHYPVRNESWVTLYKWTPITGSTTQPWTDYIVIEPFSDRSTQTALWILHQDLVDNWTWLCTNTGQVISEVDTTYWNEWTILYPASKDYDDVTTTTSDYVVWEFIFDTSTKLMYECILNSTTGVLLTNATYFRQIWFTDTKPTSWNYQACAVVTRSHQTQWTLLVEFTEPKPVNFDDRYYTETETDNLLSAKANLSWANFTWDISANNLSWTNTWDQTAVTVPYTNTTSWLTSTDVQNAIDELDGILDQLDAAVILKWTWDASVWTFPWGWVAQAWWSYIVSVWGTVDWVDFTANDRIVAIADNASTTTYAANWHKLDYTDAVLSVEWQTWAVTLWPIINSATEKTTPVDADMLWLMDSAASNILKKLSWANVKATLKTYFDTLYRSTTYTETIALACSDETTALTTWTAKVTFRMPYAFTLTEVRASLTWAWSTSWTTTIDINESWTTILSTKLTIDFWEKTSTTAATPAVISDSALADDAEITIDIDAVTWWADETGLKVYLIWYHS